MRHTITVLLITYFAAFAGLPQPAHAREHRGIDLDVRSSVVRVYQGGTFTGLGVTVGATGQVLVAWESVKGSLSTTIVREDGTKVRVPGKTIEVAASSRKRATLIDFDAALGVALLQIQGVIPRPARVYSGQKLATGVALQMVGAWTEIDTDTYPVQSSVFARTVTKVTAKHPVPAYADGKLIARMPDKAAFCVGSPTFDPKTGILIGIAIRAVGDEGEYAVIVPAEHMRRFLGGLTAPE